MPAARVVLVLVSMIHLALKRRPHSAAHVERLSGILQRPGPVGITCAEHCPRRLWPALGIRVIFAAASSGPAGLAWKGVGFGFRTLLSAAVSGRAGRVARPLPCRCTASPALPSRGVVGGVGIGGGRHGPLPAQPWPRAVARSVTQLLVPTCRPGKGSIPCTSACESNVAPVRDASCSVMIPFPPPMKPSTPRTPPAFSSIAILTCGAMA